MEIEFTNFPQNDEIDGLTYAENYLIFLAFLVTGENVTISKNRIEEESPKVHVLVHDFPERKGKEPAEKLVFFIFDFLEKIGLRTGSDIFFVGFSGKSLYE